MGEKKKTRWAILLIPLGLGAAACSRREPQAPLPPVTPQLLLAMASDPVVVAEGKELFVTICVSCHGAEGQGIVGPNLTDEVWLHGGSPMEIHTSISKGSPDKGMAPMENLLGPRKVRQLTAYVLSLKGKNVPGRPPEGKAD